MEQEKREKLALYLQFVLIIGFLFFSLKKEFQSLGNSTGKKKKSL